MTISYFKDQIHEELEGAKEYIEKAIEAKVSNPTWSKTFASMADMEATHAANLMKMLECSIKEMKGKASEMTDQTAGDVYKNCMKEFGETMTYVENMKRGLWD